jgi:hypothetical protein
MKLTRLSPEVAQILKELADECIAARRLKESQPTEENKSHTKKKSDER